MWDEDKTLMNLCAFICFSCGMPPKAICWDTSVGHLHNDSLESYRAVRNPRQDDPLKQPLHGKNKLVALGGSWSLKNQVLQVSAYAGHLPCKTAQRNHDWEQGWSMLCTRLHGWLLWTYFELASRLWLLFDLWRSVGLGQGCTVNCHSTAARWNGHAVKSKLGTPLSASGILYMSYEFDIMSPMIGSCSGHIISVQTLVDSGSESTIDWFKG